MKEFRSCCHFLAPVADCSTLTSVTGPTGFQGKGLPLVIQVLRDLESRLSGSECE